MIEICYICGKKLKGNFCLDGSNLEPETIKFTVLISCSTKCENILEEFLRKIKHSVFGEVIKRLVELEK